MNLNARLTQHWNLMRFTTQIFSQFKYDVNLYFKKINSENSWAFSKPAFSRSQTETWPLWKHILTSLHFSNIESQYKLPFIAIRENYTEYFKLVNNWELKDRKSQCEWSYTDVIYSVFVFYVFQFLYWNRWLI